MYQFFKSLKQSDGSFLVAHHAEVDVRFVILYVLLQCRTHLFCSGIYCLLVVADLLDLLTPELIDKTAGFIASCQTYEGGFSSSSQPYFSPNQDPDGQPTLLSYPRPPLGEAHGGYTFCALASWVILQPFTAAQTESAPTPSVNLKTLLRWLVQMQGSEIELGGFRGRTNKLVDGCYSWWVGGSFALLEALGVGGNHGTQSDLGSTETDETWDDVDGSLLRFVPRVNHTDFSLDSLLNRKALQEYILYAGQHPTGGLRDKPPKYISLHRPEIGQHSLMVFHRSADAYHTLYCLAGLSAAQHHVFPCSSRASDLLDAWTGERNWSKNCDLTLFPTFFQTTKKIQIQFANRHLQLRFRGPKKKGRRNSSVVALTEWQVVTTLHIL